MKRLARCERGVTSVELAVIMPVLLLFLIGLMEGGRILSFWIILTNESREAARYGAIHDYSPYCSSSSSWNTCVTNFAQQNVGLMISGTPVTVVTPDTRLQMSSDGLTPLASTVTLRYTLATATPLMQAILPQVTVETSATMRAE